MAIQFEKVSFYYNKKIQPTQTKAAALSDINLKINSQNEFIALVGKTGSGKSTLVQLMNALLTTNIGKVTAYGTTITSKTKKELLVPLRQKLGLVFQFPEYQLFETTVLKDVMFGAEVFLNNKQQAQKQALKTLEQINIPPALHQKSPFQISDGQQRKVAIAGILAMQPDILILDEPTRGLDLESSSDIMEFLQILHQTFHKTIIIITHDMNLVAQYAKRVLVLSQGKLLFDGTKENFFEHSHFEQFNLDIPDTFKILKHLNQTLGIPFKAHYCFITLAQYLKEFYC
ncbi:ECF-type transport system, ATP-binding protein [Candidatus Phytoplasma asteris]|uniref:Cobalt transport ATP-binding protein cbiO n=3 Tax=16SrI (Aster yellows group) TaxID=3042590 RepID=Q2NIT6_AYWBP|nr:MULTISPECIES: ATP-binding cassette domain-containing protein [16SrI (Aster yellows group)]ABC65657.1 cobalt transport ATP-binding protein cbiO [Aster yellows witches'-broom phytoplasma AYWB]PEH36158.1 cobalt ABC transporter ATP-binding protein [New Jersey aster yellows phytoplasma]